MRWCCTNQARRRWRSLLVLAALAFTVSARADEVPSSAAAELDKKIILAAKEGSRILANLTYLSDVIGPRVTGSPALKRANDWWSQ